MYAYTVPVLIGLILGVVISEREGWSLVSAKEEQQEEANVAIFATSTLLFAPDIMLGRSVELLMNEKGNAYPFQGLQDIVRSHTLAVGNFEASVPTTHVPTPPFTFQFSVTEDHFKAIPEAGFDVLSLANNHALDFGREGYTHTRIVCKQYRVDCVGHPTQLDSSSYTLHEVGSTTVGILMLHTLFTSVDWDVLDTLLTELKEKSDVQFAYVHWGEEYTYGYTPGQEALAHTLIDGGIDAVIGQHPHVIAPISFYKGKPIFYSLGNFVFDQYWNKEVQTGLLVSVTLGEESLTYTLIPYESYTLRSQPRPMSRVESDKLIESLLGSYSVARTYDGFAVSRD